MLKRSLAAGWFTAIVYIFCPGWTCAQPTQTYPSKPIRIVAPPPGSNVDLVARVIAQGLSPILGQPVVVQNRPDLIAIESSVSAAPDGYTALLYTSAVWIKPLLQKVDYDAVKDLLPVTRATSAPSFLFTHPSVPAQTVRELIAYAKANPGKLNYGMAGVGTSGHLAVELFKNMAGINIVQIAYKGSSEMMTNLVGNQTQVAVSSWSTGVGHIAAGRLRVLGVGGTKPSALAPDVPPIASGLPGYEISAEQCMWVPAGTPKAIVDRLNEAVLRVLNNADVKRKFQSDGTETIGTTPEQSAAHIKADIAKWARLVKEANLRTN